MLRLNRTKQSLVPLVVLIGIAGVTACGSKFDKFGIGPNHKSRVETLDNLARGDGKVHPNECSVGQLSADKKIVIKEENVLIKGTGPEQAKKLRDHVYQVIGNIPQSVLTVFFALDGIVEVNKNASAICRELQNSAVEPDAKQYSEDDHLVSCWKRNDKGAATIYVDPNAMVSDGDEGYLGIDHGLIRSFGYVTAEMFLKLDITVDSQDGNKWHVKELAQPKANDQLMLENLSSAFIKDVANSDGQYSLEDFQDLIDGTEAQKQKFRFFVFAEAFDSYHCSDETRNLIATDFPTTYKAMNAVVRSLTDEIQPANSSSLALNSGVSASASVSASISINACNCFGGLGSVLRGIFDGLGRIVMDTVQVIKRVVVGVFRIVMIPFRAVFGQITCVYEPLRAGIYIGTTPIREPRVYRSPMQHPCRRDVSQQSCLTPTKKGGEVIVDPKTPVVDKKVAEVKKELPVAPVTSGTKSEVDKVAEPSTAGQKVARKNKKKWYQCGTLGGEEANGSAPIGIILLMALPIFGAIVKREEE